MANLDVVRDALRLRISVVGSVFFFALLLTSEAAEPLTSAEQAGKRIYTSGIGTKPIRSRFTASGIDTAGSDFPCIKCHGEEGKGGREGGVTVADISPLTLSLRNPRSNGRARSAYTEKLIGRAIRDGFDPAGNALHPLMPRYTLDRGDLSDLQAYLKRLGNEPVPGVDNDAIRVGMLLPTRGSLNDIGADIAKLLRAYFNQVNAQGGVFGRSVQFSTIEFDPLVKGNAQAMIAGLGEPQRPFCYLANLDIPGGDSESHLTDMEVPVIAPLMPASNSAIEQSRNTFHIFASLYDQGRIAADYFVDTKSLSNTKIAVIYADDVLGRAAAKGIRAQAQSRSATVVVDAYLPANLDSTEMISRIKKQGASVVMLFAGGASVKGLLEEASRQNFMASFVVSIELVGDELKQVPGNVAKHLYAISTVNNLDRQSPEFSQFATLAARAGVDPRHLILQTKAYAGARLLEEALKRSQRNITRKIFLRNLEATYKLRTGVTPELTYSPNRHNGSVGAAVLRVDPETKRLYVVRDYLEAAH